jgi:hypothetical protein
MTTGTETPATDDRRELDFRVADGIAVTLLWSPSTNRVTVAVDDAKTGDAFEVPVAPGERALDVFHHPYAYAAARPAVTARGPLAPA